MMFFKCRISACLFLTAFFFLALGRISVHAGIPYDEPVKKNPYVDEDTGDPTLINFVNGSFEIPDITTDYTAGAFRFTPEHVATLDSLKYNYILSGYSEEFGWKTVPVKAEDEGVLWADYIEIMHNDSTLPQIFSADGDQFAELNASVEGRLYQYCNTIPGQKVYYEYYHKGREGFDTMHFYLCAPGEYTAPEEESKTDNDAWVRYFGVYEVPDGQTVTEFAFESVSSATGNKNNGNLLDAIRLFYPSFLELEKTLTTRKGTVLSSGGETVLLGDTLTYTVTISNNGETNSSRTVLTDILPDGVEYIPDSTLINGSPAGNLAQFDPSADLLLVNIGDGATPGNQPANGGSITKGDTVTVSFDVVITGEHVLLGQEIKNQAKVTYNDEDFETYNNFTDAWNVSNTISFIIASPVAIEITKELSEAPAAPETFVFLVEYQLQDQAPVIRSFYCTAKLDGTNNTIAIDNLAPGIYTITEIKNNWQYTIDTASNEVQSKTLDGIMILDAAVTFKNNRETDNLISGKNRADNQLCSFH